MRCGRRSLPGNCSPATDSVEADISQQMGVSRGPVREALRQLEQEGLAISYPYKGTEVLGVSQAEVEAILVPIRLILECFAFRHAVPHLHQEDLDQLANIVEQMRVAVQQHHLAELAEADIKFHELVIVRSNQQHCEQIWRTIAPRVRAYFLRDAPAHSSPIAVVDEHRELLEALNTRNVDYVLEVLERHIHNFVKFHDGDTGK